MHVIRVMIIPEDYSKKNPHNVGTHESNILIHTIFSQKPRLLDQVWKGAYIVRLPHVYAS